MKYLVFSDVHGNLPALKTVISDAGKVDGYINLGDVVGYGPWINECVELVASLENCTSILGNHEQFFLNNSCHGCKVVAEAFFNHCSTSFTQTATIQTYLPKAQLGKYTLTHTILDTYIYPDTQVNLDTNYMIGHSHHQFQITSGEFKLLNPGSVGQNRKNLAAAQYLIYDTVLDSVEFKTCEYDVLSVLQEMERQHYPDLCMAYYKQKIITK